MRSSLKIVVVIAMMLSGIHLQCLAQDSVSVLPLKEHERAALFPSRAVLTQGEILAATTCAGCHGLDGIGTDENRPHLAGQRTIYLYREILAYKNGDRVDESMSRAVRFLADESIMQVATYYASLVPPRPDSGSIDAHEPGWISQDPLIDVETAIAGCGTCHGSEGNSAIPGMPSLTAQHPDYFTAAIKTYQNGERTDGMMKMLVTSLDEETIQDMGLFYALQEPLGSASTGPGDAQAGGQLAQACAGCHGTDGNVTAPGTPSIAGQDAIYAVKAMNAYLNGQRQHGGMSTVLAGLDKVEISNLAAFYAQQVPVPRNVRKPLTTSAWIERCDRCHGINGNSTDPRYAALAAQNEAYLTRVLHAYADGQRSDSIMHAMSRSLSKGVIARLAAYYAAQEPRAVVYFELPCNLDGD
jgi:cytochrome c553